MAISEEVPQKRGSRRVTRRKTRRPSGDPPPLPRKLDRSGKAWLFAGGGVFLTLLLVAIIGSFGSKMDLHEGRFLEWFSGIRTPALTKVMRSIDVVGSDWTIALLQWSVIATLLVFKRFRHLLVFLGSLVGVTIVAGGIGSTFIRGRPFDVEMIGHWAGGPLPSRPIAALCTTLVGLAYTLIPHGRLRNLAKLATVAVVGLYALSRIYLGTEHPTDLLTGTVIGTAIPLVAFRLLTPNAIFPVAYRRGRAAHLDVEGPRGIAIRTALEQQLNLKVKSIKPFGLAGSGGSTPLRLEIEDDETPFLFAKLYAATHLRADRWYKLGRTLLYGRLEDETAFSTVRRLIQYEDYLLRVMRDAGIPTAKPLGFVEITPEREYLIVTEFIDGGTEILDVDVDEEIIDNALAKVRLLWDAGLAHRDIKPSNLLVRDKEVFLIDVAFGQVRPSPWREAVDLANMMLVLAFKSSPEKVYERALLQFTADEIAEAFAATRSITIPSQSRGLLKAGKAHDIVKRFVELAPKRAPVSIQRWSWRRAVLTAGVALAFIIGVQLVISNLRGIGLLGSPRATLTYAAIGRPAECERPLYGEQTVLEAQSVPSATLVPCLNPLPEGWHLKSFLITDDGSQMWLESDRAVGHPVHVVLRPECDVSGASQVPTDELGTERYERVDTLGDGYRGRRSYLFEGGCVTYDFDFTGEGRTGLVEEASQAVAFKSVEEMLEEYEELAGFKPGI